MFKFSSDVEASYKMKTSVEISVAPEESTSDGTAVNDKNENIKYGFDIIKKEYDSALKRFYEWDNKLNMLFVFVASEIIALSTIYSVMVYEWGAFIVSAFIMISVVAILVGLFSKKLETIGSKQFKNERTYEYTNFEFIGAYISAYADNIAIINKKSTVKSRCFTVAILALLISLTVLIIFMFLGR